MDYCERCDLKLSECMHGLARQREERERNGVVNVSPQGMAHFPGCSHKAEGDDDYRRWGTLSEPGVWQRLATEQIPTQSTLGTPLVARRRCDTCLDHGPW